MEMTKKMNIMQVTNGSHAQCHDLISVEEPIEIRVTTGKADQRKTTAISVTMRTPGHDDELALGFLFTEGVIKGSDQILQIHHADSNIIEMEFGEDVVIDTQQVSRNFYTTSSCGVCGKSSIEAITIKSGIVSGDLCVATSVLQNLVPSLIKEQKTFQTTGGLHASALFDQRGKLLLAREDVGRHNALDKLIGSMLLTQNFPLSNNILLVSGRASFELVQKAAVAGIPIVTAIGAPSSLAVELAQEKGISLIGFLKQDRFNIYAHPNRIKLNETRI
jgi:FdhD protein